MRRTKRHFTNEFKNQILAEAERGTAITDLAKQHDLTVTMICRWKRQLREGVIDQAVESAPRASSGVPGVDLKYVRECKPRFEKGSKTPATSAHGLLFNNIAKGTTEPWS